MHQNVFLAVMSLLNSTLVVNLVSLISRDDDLTSVFFYKPSEGNCHLEKTLAIGILPKLIWRSETSKKFYEFISEGLLVLACIPETRSMDVLRSLSSSLRYRRQARIIVELMTKMDESLLHKVLRFCHDQDMFNTNVIFTDFRETKLVYGFDVYPDFKVINHLFNNNSQLSSLYPSKMQNLRGGKIRTIPDFSEPNTILHQDAEGGRKILGYVWNMIETYARHCNASLEIVNKYADGRALNFVEIWESIQRGVVDVTASIQPMTLNGAEKFHNFAYPSDVASWCTMLPVERDLNVPEIYSLVTPVTICIILIIIWIFFHFLQRFWRRHQRFRTIGWLILATFVTSNYLGRMLAFLAVPPSVPPIANLQDLLESSVRILSLRSEFKFIEFTQRTKYTGAFRLTESTTELIQMRNSLNTSFGYTTSSTKWQLYREQQKRCSRPLFRYSTDICYYHMVPLALLIPENSAHRSPLQHFSLKLWQSGLFDLWVSRGFTNMVKAGRISAKNLRTRHQPHKLTLADLQNVIAIYCFGLLIGLALFMGELVVSWAKSWLGF
ncbi:hypothetical protein KR018_006853 [Drosophila ironensis]|nr:hypothetical protein KR018_006853 [Drosophila ironensis]